MCDACGCMSDDPDAGAPTIADLLDHLVANAREAEDAPESGGGRVMAESSEVASTHYRPQSPPHVSGRESCTACNELRGALIDTTEALAAMLDWLDRGDQDEDHVHARYLDQKAEARAALLVARGALAVVYDAGEESKAFAPKCSACGGLLDVLMFGGSTADDRDR